MLTVRLCVLKQVKLMDLVPDDKEKGLQTPIWAEYKKIVNEAEGKAVCYCNHYKIPTKFRRSGPGRNCGKGEIS